MIREIKFEDGKEKVAEGMRSLCHVLHYEGRVLVNGAYGFSALEVAGNIEGPDLFFNQGVRLAAEAIGEVNQAVGCGTKESACLMEHLLSHCERKAASGVSPVLLAKELKQAAGALEAHILEKTVPPTKSKVELVEEITNDEEIAKMIIRGSKEGELVVKESMFAGTRLEITRGMRLDGPLSVGKDGAVSDALILILKRPLTSFKSIYPILEKIGNQNLFVLADEIDGEALTLLKTNEKQNRIHVRAMKAPGIGRRKEDLLEDAAAYTDTVAFDGFYPCALEAVSPAMLGRVKSVTSAGTYTILEGTLFNERIQKRIEAIKDRIGDPKTNYYDKQKLRERIAGLKGSAPVIYTGGYTLVQSKEEKRRIESAVAYAQTIEQYGIFRKEDILNFLPGSESEKFLAEAIKQTTKKPEISSGLLVLMLQKVCGLIAIWLTTGAVMVSTGYDREDLELIKNGVDIERLRN